MRDYKVLAVPDFEHVSVQMEEFVEWALRYGILVRIIILHRNQSDDNFVVHLLATQWKLCTFLTLPSVGKKSAQFPFRD